MSAGYAGDIEGMTDGNDIFGYNRYAIMVMAPEDIARQIADLQAAVMQTETGLTNSAHITVVPPFFGIESLDVVRQKIGELSSHTAPLTIDLVGNQLEAVPDYGAAAFALQEHPDVVAVQKELEAALAPHVAGSNYSGEWRYRKHMGLIWSLPEDRLKTALELAEKIDLGAGFVASTMVLVGYKTGVPLMEPIAIDEFVLGTLS